MDIRRWSNSVNARSVEKVMYKSTVKHACNDGGQVIAMRDVQMERDRDGTLYGYCNNCRRAFYSQPQRQHGSGYKQFAVAYGSR